MAYENETFIKGFRPVHSAEIISSRVEETVQNFRFQVQSKNIRDLLIENLGPKDVYIRFSQDEIDTIDIPDPTSQYLTFSGDATGWVIRPDRPFSLSSVDFVNIGMIVAPGDGYTNVQILAACYSR